MKKTLFALIALCLILSMMLCGCNFFGEPVDIEKDKMDDGEESEKGEDDSKEEKDTSKDETPVRYWEIECYTTKSYTERHFSVDGADSDVCLSVSSEWSFEDGEDGYDILRDGNIIGAVVKGDADDLDAWNKADEFTRKYSESLSVTKTVESKGTGKNTQFRYRFKYSFADGENTRVLTLIANYEELDANAADKLYVSAELYGNEDSLLGSLAELQDKEILILGNSFIGSSSVGTILREMISVNNKGLSVSPISRGYATVQTYVEDAGIMDSIRNGAYKGVFICGFYSNPEVDYLKTLREACNASETTLVVFPAHNEERNVIKKAQQACPELYTLDWKAEVDSLIESGIERSHFCINDEHQHSTELAGIVGAHMIYRAIYGESPSLDGVYAVTAYNAHELLGSYLTDGKIPYNYEVLYV
jgi:hypothetical protein